MAILLLPQSNNLYFLTGGLLLRDTTLENKLVDHMLFSGICRDFIEPPSFCNIYITCIANTFFPSTQTHREPTRIFCKSLFQQGVPEQQKVAHVCSWKTSLLSDNFPEHFPFLTHRPICFRTEGLDSIQRFPKS